MPSFLKSTLETPLLGLSEPVIDNGLLLFLVCDQKKPYSQTWRQIISAISKI